jgi:hypothetical protein
VLLVVAGSVLDEHAKTMSAPTIPINAGMALFHWMFISLLPYLKLRVGNNNARK